MAEIADRGLVVIRAALLNRRFKGHLGYLARDHGIGVSALEDFAYGKASLPPDVLDALAKDLLGPNVSYDGAVDKLRRAEVATTPLSRIAQLDQRTALPDQCLHSAAPKEEVRV